MITTQSAWAAPSIPAAAAASRTAAFAGRPVAATRAAASRSSPGLHRTTLSGRRGPVPAPTAPAVLPVEAGPPPPIAVAAQSLDDERVVGGHARLVEHVVEQLVVPGVGHTEPVADGLGLRAGEDTPGPLEVDDVAAPLRELHQDSDPRLKVRPGQRPRRVADDVLDQLESRDRPDSHRQRWHSVPLFRGRSGPESPHPGPTEASDPLRAWRSFSPFAITSIWANW